MNPDLQLHAERTSDANSIRWFEAEPCYIYHISNAREEGDEIILDGCRMETPEPPPIPADASVSDINRLLAWGRLDARLYRWRFNMVTGETKEEWRDDRFTEFPMVNAQYGGRKIQYAYHMLVSQTNPTLQLTGLAKYELDSGHAEVHEFDPGCYASEAPFAPRDGATSEDDGYLVTFVANESDLSELQIFHAQQLSAGPIARVKLPVNVPPGFHACWGPDSLLS